MSHHRQKRDLAARHVHMGLVDEAHAFGLEKLDLLVGASKCESRRNFTVLFDYAVAGDDAGFRIDMERVAHNPGKALVADRLGDLAVGSDIADGDLFDCLVDFVENAHVPAPMDCSESKIERKEPSVM